MNGQTPFRTSAITSLLYNPYSPTNGADYAEECYREHLWALMLSGAVSVEIIARFELDYFSRTSIEHRVLAKAQPWASRHISEIVKADRRLARTRLDPVKSILQNPYQFARGLDYAKARYIKHLQALCRSGTIADQDFLSCNLEQFGRTSIERDILSAHIKWITLERKWRDAEMPPSDRGEPPRPWFYGESRPEEKVRAPSARRRHRQRRRYRSWG